MGRRKGPSLTPKQVLEAAVAVVQAHGADALGISRVARELEIKPASMYNHVTSGDALARAVVLEGNRRILEVFKASVRGVVEPRQQLRALAHTARQWALDNDGLYTLMARIDPDNHHPDFEPVYRDMLDLFDRPLGQLGVLPEDRIHAIRGVRAAIHGFVLLETSGQFKLPDNIDDSYDWLLEAVVRGVVPSGSPE